MQDLIAALISFFLVEPLQHGVAEALASTRAPREIVVSIASCAAEHGPEIVNRAVDDPWWATSSAFSVWIGFADPYAILVEAAPKCAAAVEAARPFLNPQDGQTG